LTLSSIAPPLCWIKHAYLEDISISSLTSI
jgi:hypothetical protein